MPRDPPGEVADVRDRGQGVRGVDGVEYRFDTIVVGTTDKYAATTRATTPKDRP